MTTFRHLTPQEIIVLEERHTHASDWSRIEVSDDFQPTQLFRVEFSGVVRIASNVHIRNAYICNYSIGNDTLIEDVVRLECRHTSAFGEGTPVAVMNENGGRTIHIFSELTAQIAYITALYRHRPRCVEALEQMALTQARQAESLLGFIGPRCRIIGCRLLREVRLAHDVTLEGVSLLENGSIGAHAFVGIDVKAYNFILSEAAHIDNGSIIERCFVGECCHIDRGFSAIDSLFFANSHCENGEAVSIFAAPYTVSHHKSSLLIAGFFSFFNAGSGANQSNHLFKCGAVHQSVHRRGCKFASSAYVMSPAIEGIYTMVMGRHTHHHDTSAFPFSYLLEQEGSSALIPAANLASYGTIRDIAKWPQRDKRIERRDLIRFEQWNPYVGEALQQGIATLTALHEQNPDAQTYIYNNVHIKALGIQRGLHRYHLALAATLSSLLPPTAPAEIFDADTVCDWIDVAGLYVTRHFMVQLLTDIEQGVLTTVAAILSRFSEFNNTYTTYAQHWALAQLQQRLGHTPSDADIAHAIQEGISAEQELQQLTERDRLADCSPDMSVGYGIDALTAHEREDDYRSVRGFTTL
jgi:hypothetical protein